MHSTRKQKAEEKRSRQPDVMSDVENLDIMLGSYSRNDVDTQLSENEENADLRSNERHPNSNLGEEDSRTYFIEYQQYRKQ